MARGASAPLLLNLSGGVDSTYALHLLTEQGVDLVVHHCVLRSHEARENHESRAVRKILDWFRARGHQFDYIQTGFNYGSVKHIIRDIEIIRFMTGVILRGKRWQHVDTVVASGIAEDPDLTDEERGRIHTILEATARRPVKLVRPIRAMSKADIIAAMPADLFELTWYCRRPRGPRPCGQCRTCGHVADRNRVGGVPDLSLVGDRPTDLFGRDVVLEGAGCDR